MIAVLLCGVSLQAGSTGSAVTVDDLSWASNTALLDSFGIDSFGLSSSDFSMVSSLLSLQEYSALSGGSSPSVLFSGFLMPNSTLAATPATIWNDSALYQSPSQANSSAAIQALLFSNLSSALASIPGGTSQDFLLNLESSIVLAPSSAALTGSSVASSSLTSLTATTTSKTGAVTPATSAVPEPATLVLLGCAIVAFSLVIANRSAGAMDEPQDASAGSSWHKNI